MQRAGWLFLLLVGLWGCGSAHPAGQVLADGPGGDTCCTGRFAASTFAARSTAELGGVYRQLRRRRCPACARYNSDLHAVLRVLGERLEGQPLAALAHTLGPPDRTRGDSLIYYWRGEHDYLFFRPAPGRLVHGAWYFAYE